MGHEELTLEELALGREVETVVEDLGVVGGDESICSN